MAPALKSFFKDHYYISRPQGGGRGRGQGEGAGGGGGRGEGASGGGGGRGEGASVVYSETASTRDILKSYFEVVYEEMKGSLGRKGTEEVTLDQLFDAWMEGVKEKGWNTESHLLGVGEWRCSLK
jgi:hypothetical protein